MVGPLKEGLDGFTHLLIAVDKFTKWIEAKPITNIHSEEAVKFFLDIIYRFGVPNFIITDCGGINPYTLMAKLGPARIGGSVHQKTTCGPVNLIGVPRKESRRIWRSIKILVS